MKVQPHMSANDCLEPNKAGFYTARCECGWQFGPLPGLVEVTDVLMEHAAEVVERERVRAATRLLQLQVVVSQAVSFLNNRRDDGIEFPYDSRPLRKLRETEAKGRAPDQVDAQ